MLLFPNDNYTATDGINIAFTSGMVVGTTDRLLLRKWTAPAGSLFTEQRFYPSEPTQTFAVDGNYIPGAVCVYFNGIALYDHGDGFVANDGINVVTTPILSASDSLLVRKWTTDFIHPFNELIIAPTSENQTSIPVVNGYTLGSIELYLNGIMLYGGGDNYTAVNGTTIVLTDPIDVEDRLLLRKWYSSNTTIFGTTTITATANQTVFTIPSGYTPGAISVSLNGFLLHGSGDWHRSGALSTSCPATRTTIAVQFVRRMQLNKFIICKGIYMGRNLSQVSDPIGTQQLGSAAGASLVGFQPGGGLTATDLQSALTEIDSEKLAASALSAADGASKIGWVQAGAESLGEPLDSRKTRLVSDKLREVVSVRDFGAVGDGVTDDTAAIQAAIDYAASLVIASTDGVGDPIGGTDVIFAGTYKVTQSLRVAASNINLIGKGGTTIYAYFNEHTAYNIAKPVFIIGSAELWQTSGAISTTYKYNSVVGINIKTVAGYEGYVGFLFSGTRNASIRDCLIERGYIGVYLENTSEFYSSQLSVIGCGYGIIQDNRGNRPASSSILNVANTDNDVSSNTFVMTTLYYPQHTGFMSINSGTTSIMGMTVGNFSENPAPFPGLGLPPEAAGIHFYGQNLKWTRGGMINNVVLEPSENKRIDCIRIDSPDKNNQVSGLTFNNCHVQTHASNYASNLYTVLLRMNQVGSGAIRNVVVRDSGFTPQTVGYDTGTMCINEGGGEVFFDSCYPNTSFATSSIGVRGNIRHLEYIERTEINSLTPLGWAIEGVATGSSKQGGSDGVPAYIKLTGDVNPILLYKDFYFRERVNEISQVFITFLVRGDIDVELYARVNGVASTDSNISSVENIPRYGNALIGPIVNGSPTEWSRYFFCFTPFDVNYPFDRVMFVIGKPASAYNSNYIEVTDIKVGYIPGAISPYNPFQ